MAIANYTDLLAAISDWSHHTDVAAKAPEFVALGEAFLNRRFRSPLQMVTATITTSTSDRFAALPDRYLENIGIAYLGRELFYNNPGAVLNAYQSSSPAMPSCYAITTRYEFDCVSDQPYNMTATYYQSLDIASDGTNFLLTANPDVYLAAAMVNAAVWIRDQEAMAFWVAKRDQEIEEALNYYTQSKARILTTDFPIAQPFDILRG